jgi:hypothetical protein
VIEGVGVTVLPKRWRRRPPVMAGMVGRWRRRFRVRQRARGREGESVGAGLGQLTDPDPSRSGSPEPGGLVGPNGPRPICLKSNPNFKF